MTAFETYLNAERMINEGLIRLDVSLARPDGCGALPRARMAQMAAFLEACGAPQRGIPAVHVVGTSGKGSVSAAVAAILREAGLSVGLHVSPYLQAASEKISIDGAFVSAEEFARLVDWVMPIAAPLVHPRTAASIHGMASVAIALEAFRRHGVDVMVVEAGCGARHDLTSFVQTAVGVLTNVGMDHLVSLGPTLEDIAWNKAGVARPGVPVVTGATGASLEILRREVASVGGEIVEIPPSDGALANNRDLAVEAARLMAARLGRALSDEAIARGLSHPGLAGRCEAMPGGGPTVILDGAHNAEKLSVAAASALSRDVRGKRVLVLGLLGTKAGLDFVAPLRGAFDLAVTTEPSVYAKPACPAERTARVLREAGMEAIARPDPWAALDLGIELAGPDGLVLVTGSFYLVGQLRERWFAKERVVLERTSWPQSTGSFSG